VLLITSSDFPLVIKTSGSFYFIWRNSPQWARVSSFTKFLDHTQRRSTVGRLLWTSDQLIAKTSTWQHTTLTTDRHPRPQT